MSLILRNINVLEGRVGLVMRVGGADIQAEVEMIGVDMSRIALDILPILGIPGTIL